jgi:hypothetical protein
VHGPEWATKFDYVQRGTPYAVETSFQGCRLNGRRLLSRRGDGTGQESEPQKKLTLVRGTAHH